jgi:lipopolysaccharide transport system ATP-binding protein
MSKIVVDGVSKKFNLQRDRATSVKEMFTRIGRDKTRDEFWALDDVSLEIEEGSMYALVGHNGSGKSTLLRCIAGIYRPDAGHVEVSGRISTLLELGAGFHPDLSGRENIFLNAAILGMSKRDIEGKLDEIIEFAGVQEFIDSPVKVYSSGMYVRLGFAVAVNVEPEILIIDEVIAVGDEEFQRRCFDHLYSLRRQGVTIVVVTHGMGLVETMCDKAAWLDHGQLQLVGPGAEVATSYLSRVNEEEREDRETIVAPSVETGSDGDGDDEPDRSNEPIRLVDVDFIDDEGRSAAAAIHREALTIRIHYDARQPVESPVFGIALFSLNGVHVTGTNTRIDEVDIGTVSGPGHVDFHVDALPLTPGDYELTVAIDDEHVLHTFDRRERDWHLAVRQGPDRLAPEGVMDMIGDWAYEPE